MSRVERELVSIEMPDSTRADVYLIWARTFDEMPAMRLLVNALTELFSDEIQALDT
jgi:hypothetical protein